MKAAGTGRPALTLPSAVTLPSPLNSTLSMPLARPLAEVVYWLEPTSSDNVALPIGMPVIEML